eukprot:gb/GECG01002685.1/.p1 GENE.gb/GECG01002685.1/~~gb/GECG01002685.1/.p1  ORF type:complete len:964 (+),score=71.78 gb/GECG01002685.1/:1-2892(+)
MEGNIYYSSPLGNSNLQQASVTHDLEGASSSEMWESKGHGKAPHAQNNRGIDVAESQNPLSSMNGNDKTGRCDSTTNGATAEIPTLQQRRTGGSDQHATTFKMDRTKSKGAEVWQQIVYGRKPATRRGSVVWEDPRPANWLLRLLLLFCCLRRWHYDLEEKEARAVLLVKNALHGRPTAFPSKDSLIARVIYHSRLNMWATVAVAASYLLLAQWEEPSDLPANHVVLHVLEVFSIVWFTVQLRIEWLYFDRTLFFRKKWSVVKLIALPIMCFSLLLSVTVSGFPHFARVLRPIFLLDRLRNVRKITTNILETVPKIVNVMILVWFVIIIFGVTGNVLFGGIGDGNCSSSADAQPDPPTCSVYTDKCDDYFNTVDNSIVHMFTLSTTSNFPQIMLPAYRCSPWNALFFILFLLINVYLLFSLMLAVAFTEFKALTEKKVMERFSNMFAGCDDAFAELIRTSEEGAQDRQQPQRLSREGWVKFYRSLKPFADEEFSGKLFDCMDTCHRGSVDYIQFRKMILLFAELSCQPTDLLGRPQSFFRKKLEVRSSPQKDLIQNPDRESRPSDKPRCKAPEWCWSRTQWRERLDSTNATVFFDCVILVNTAIVITMFQLRAVDPKFQGSTKEDALATVQHVTFGVFLFEVLAKVAAFGLKNYWKAHIINKFDVIIVIASSIGEVVEATSDDSTRYSTGVAFLRMIRLVRVLRFLPDFMVMIRSFRDTFPVLLQYLIALLCALYAFAILGMEAFAGKFTCGNNINTDVSYCVQGFQALTFNSLDRAFMVLFQQMVVNDFPVIMEGAVAATSKAARVYFIVYVLSVTVLVLNVLVAFIIESFSVQRERNARVSLEKSSVLKPGDSLDRVSSPSPTPSDDWAKRRETPRSCWSKLIEKIKDTRPSIGDALSAKAPGTRHDDGAIEVDYWKVIMLSSNQDFSKWVIHRRPHTHDIYRRLYSESIKKKFPEVFETE